MDTVFGVKYDGGGEFGSAAAGCGVQSEHEAHACCLGSGGLLQTVSSDRYHVPWGWIGPGRRRGIIQSHYIRHAMLVL